MSPISRSTGYTTSFRSLARENSQARCSSPPETLGKVDLPPGKPKFGKRLRIISKRRSLCDKAAKLFAAVHPPTDQRQASNGQQ